MKLLVTGAAHFDNEQLNTLSSLGFEVLEQKDERGAPETDFSQVDAAVLNGLFLYHDFEQFGSLKFIQLTSAGLGRVPVDKITQKGIALFNARGVYSIPMAECAVAGVLELYKKLNVFYENQKSHVWQKLRNLKELNGCTVSVIGCGSVGTECAKRFSSFGTSVIGVDVCKNDNPVYDCFYNLNDIEKALAVSDIVVLTLPLTEETKGMFNRDMFKQFKNDCVLVNVSRGAVVNESDLVDALKDNLGGAVLDVFENEPLDEKSELWDMSNVVITPHNSFASPNNTKRLFELTYNNLSSFLKGEK